VIVMTINIGEVTTFANPKADKAQVVKIAEEYGEIYSAWENLQEIKEMYRFGKASYSGLQFAIKKLVDECADLFTATANLLVALNVDDNQMRRAMQDCKQRNRDRGRL
jgi:NTP pyrophosphatase (non-canonical NTP hydrolase)